MKAAVIHEQGGPDVLVYEEIPDPRPADDEVVLDVSVISLEGGDLLNRRILPVEKFPHVIGYAAAGHIAEIGKKVTGLNVGQRGAAFNFSGSHAEKFRAPANYVFKQFCLIPIDKIGKSLALAMANPLNVQAIEDVELLSDCSVQTFVDRKSTRL